MKRYGLIAHNEKLRHLPDTKLNPTFAKILSNLRPYYYRLLQNNNREGVVMEPDTSGEIGNYEYPSIRESAKANTQLPNSV